MPDIDTLLNQAVIEGEIESGAPVALLIAQCGDLSISSDVVSGRPARSNRWTEAEESFVRNNLGILAEDEIAKILGRSPIAVKLRRYRCLEMPPASDHPEYYNGRAAARTLGVDDHTLIKLLELGKIPYWRLGGRETYMMRRVSLWRFAVNPMNWCYFWRSVQDLRRIIDPHLRRLIARQKERWDDEWWTPGQVAEYYGVGHTDVNRYIHSGRLERTAKFGNNWVLRSEATKEGIYFVKGKGKWRPEWSEAADCFILIARSLNVFYCEMAGMMKMAEKSVAARRRVLHHDGLVQQLIDKYGLEIDYDPATGEVKASRETYGWMFPRVDWDYRWRR